MTDANTEFEPGFLLEDAPPAPTVTVYSVVPVVNSNAVSAEPPPPELSLLKDAR